MHNLPRKGPPSAEEDAAAEAVYWTMEAASEADRLWFVAHPRRSYRVRPHILGEWPPGSLPPPPRGWREYTVVRQVMPGFRLRLAFSAEGEPGQGERAAERLYELMLRGGPR